MRTPVTADRSSTINKVRQPIPPPSDPSSNQPDGSSVRRGWRRAASALGGLLLLLSLLCLATWLLAITITDRWQLSQFLFWFNPGLVMLAACCFLVGWGLKRTAGTRRSGRLTGSLVALCAAAMLAREFGVFRWVGHLGASRPPASGSIRIAHWNLSVYDVPERFNIGDALAAEGTPDIILISMQNNPRLWEQLGAAVKGATSDKVAFANTGDEKIFSRFPISATQCFHIPFKGTDTQPPVPSTFVRRCFSGLFRVFRLHNRPTTSIEDATVVGLTFDTRALLGRTTSAWFIDMPSNPLACKAQLVEHVVARTAELRASGELPAPDFIVGDFNIPIGSQSLKTYAPGFHPASDSAGLGRLASWPRPNPVLQIDHLLVAPSWRAAEYRLLEPGASEHLAQTAVLWPADTSAQPSTLSPASSPHGAAK